MEVTDVTRKINQYLAAIPSLPEEDQLEMLQKIVLATREGVRDVRATKSNARLVPPTFASNHIPSAEKMYRLSKGK